MAGAGAATQPMLSSPAASEPTAADCPAAVLAGPVLFSSCWPARAGRLVLTTTAQATMASTGGNSSGSRPAAPR